MESYIGTIIALIVFVISIIGLNYSLNYQKKLKEKGIINMVKDVEFFYG